MILEKVYKEFGDALPDRSAFRSNPPVSFREVIKEYKTWGRFVVAYNNFAQTKREVKNLYKPLKVPKYEIKTTDNS